MSRLIAYSGRDPIASLSFYACECGMYFKARQEQSINGSAYRCECGRTIAFHGRVVSLWKTRNLDSLFGAGWTAISLSDMEESGVFAAAKGAGF